MSASYSVVRAALAAAATAVLVVTSTPTAIVS